MKLKKANKRLKKSSKECKRGMTATVVTLTPLGGVGLIAHGGAILEKLNQLINHSYEKKRYFIFMVRFGQFPEIGQRQIAYINNFHRS